MKLFIMVAISKGNSVRLTFTDGNKKVFDRVGQDYNDNNCIEFLLGSDDKQILVNLAYVTKIEVIDHQTPSET